MAADAGVEIVGGQSAHDAARLGRVSHGSVALADEVPRPLHGHTKPLGPLWGLLNLASLILRCLTGAGACGSACPFASKTARFTPSNRHVSALLAAGPARRDAAHAPCSPVCC